MLLDLAFVEAFLLVGDEIGQGFCIANTVLRQGSIATNFTGDVIERFTVAGDPNLAG